jgi:hypothetical protein
MTVDKKAVVEMLSLYEMAVDEMTVDERLLME